MKDPMDKIKDILRTVHTGYELVFHWPFAIKQAFKATYYPEVKQKSALKKICENFKWFFKYKEVNGFYQQYGFDVELGRDQREYKDYYHFAVERGKQNLVGKPNSQIVLLRDKFLFFVYMRANKLPVPEVFAYSQNGVLRNADLIPIGLEDLKDEKDYFIKDYTGECASFVKRIKDFEDLLCYKDEIKNTGVIFQKAVIQNKIMNSLNPGAVNTMRVITVRSKGEIHVLSLILRIGTAETGNVDNTAKGGIAIGVNENGYLKEFGLKKPKYAAKGEGRVYVHPDTGVVFSEFCVPFYKEALDLAKRAHGVFYNVKSIGWDIAITDNGPVIIEGNDNWEISSIQACNSGLRKKWEELTK